VGVDAPEVGLGGVGKNPVLQFQVADGAVGVGLRKVLEFQLGLVVESEVVVSLIVGNDFIGIEVAIFQFLVVAATLEGVAGAYEPGHFLVELVDSEWRREYLRFSLERILSLWNSM
jgi:hypothetical protein